MSYIFIKSDIMPFDFIIHNLGRLTWKTKAKMMSWAANFIFELWAFQWSVSWEMSVLPFYNLFNRMCKLDWYGGVNHRRQRNPHNCACLYRLAVLSLSRTVDRTNVYGNLHLRNTLRKSCEMFTVILILRLTRSKWERIKYLL